MANQLSDIDWFKWNGTKCTEYGMHVLSQPSIVMPTERVTTESIPGRSGSLTILEGKNIYDDLSLSCTCIIDSPYENNDETNLSRISAICGWLKGGGTVSFANQSEGYYQARVSNQISFDKIVQGNPHMSFSVQFRCSPFLYLNSGSQIVTATAGTPLRLTNQGNVPSAPLIKVYGTGEGTIMCGDSSMIVESFDGISYIMLDCEAKIAYKGTSGDANDPLQLLGTRVTGDWITIPEGASYVTLTGGLTSAVITPKWRRIG